MPNVQWRELEAIVHLTQTYRELDPNAVLPWPVLAQLRALIPCDDVQVWGQDFAAGTSPFARQEYGDIGIAPPQEVFDAHYWACASCSYPQRTGDLASVTQLSDFYDDRTCRRSAMSTSRSGSVGVMRELRVCLPAGPDRILRLLLWRGPGRDFTDRDRAMLRLLRPHLHAAWRATQQATRDAVALTTRQRQVLSYVAAGYSNKQIARKLALTEHTVSKHLENIYARLQVNSRTAAAGIYESGVRP